MLKRWIVYFGIQKDVDENEEEDKENAEGKLRFSGGHGEVATYDEGDEEDVQLAAKPSPEDVDDEDVGVDQVWNRSKSATHFGGIGEPLADQLDSSLTFRGA